jgi:GMP synthase (glutamine-hydrolysing)
MTALLDQEIARIRDLVGEEGQVLGAVSGGVDSTVAAKLMKEAIRPHFRAVLVDNGLMRHPECASKEGSFRLLRCEFDCSRCFATVPRGSKGD